MLSQLADGTKATDLDHILENSSRLLKLILQIDRPLVLMWKSSFEYNKIVVNIALVILIFLNT